MNSKQLHKHSLPIIVLSTGLGMISLLLLSRIVMVSSTGDHFLRDLTAPQLSLKPATNGLFHISRLPAADQADSNGSLGSSGQPNTGLGAINTSGQSTELNAALAQ